jgi:hypothetical protein
MDDEMTPGAVINLQLFTLGKTRKTSARRSFDQGCATSHRFKWDLLPPNDVGNIAQHVRMGEGLNGGGDGLVLV